MNSTVVGKSVTCIGVGLGMFNIILTSDYWLWKGAKARFFFSSIVQCSLMGPSLSHDPVIDTIEEQC